MKRQSALFALVIGLAILAIWFREYWPASHWTVVPRAQLVDKGHQTAQHFGINVAGWKTYVVPSVSRSLEHYGHGVSPLAVRITYVSQHGDAVEVGFDSAGALTYWRAPGDYKTARRFGSDDEAAHSALQFIAGTQAAGFKPPRKSAGNGPREEEYEFRKDQESSSPLKERITVRTKDSAVERMDRRVSLSISDSDDDDEEGYWSVLSVLDGFFYTIAFVAVVGIFILWQLRKALNRRFQVRMAIGGFCIMLLVLVAGSEWDKIKSVHVDSSTPVVPQVFMAIAILLCAAVGRGISPEARPKWMSLEQLCLLAPVGKPTGETLAVGVLFSPLLAAIPFLITGSGLIPGSWVQPRNADLLYSRNPLVDSLSVTVCLWLLLFFGFIVPALQRLIRQHWLRWAVVLPVGTIFFADQLRVISGPIAAPLLAGLMMFALFWFVWKQYDMLAVLTLQLASGFVMGLLILMQKHESAWAFIAALCGLLIAAFWCNRHGTPVAEGDPLATNPMLTGFRAEREKLLAEFSVARRAQQDMLPQSPPDIPGYTIAASCTPSLEVGGDLYDFLKLQDGRIGIGVADVSGKGVPAALYMTLTKGLLSSVTQNSSELGPVMEEVNRHLHGVTRKKVFVTMALGFLDAGKRVLQCVRAGHNPMVWRQKSKGLTTLVTPGGMGLGITAGRIFGAQLKVAELELSDGDAVVFYSDGITEAMNRSLEQFGEQRLMDAVDRTDGLDAAAARDSILDEVRNFLDGFHPQDDMTLVVLRVGEQK